VPGLRGCAAEGVLAGRRDLQRRRLLPDGLAREADRWRERLVGQRFVRLRLRLVWLRLLWLWLVRLRVVRFRLLRQRHFRIRLLRVGVRVRVVQLRVLRLLRLDVVKGFREFLLRGNVIDLAVAVVIGAAFTAIVTAVVSAIINPLIGAVFNASSLDKALIVRIPTVSGGHAPLMFGSVIGAVINFVIVAAVVYFALVLPVNHLKKVAFDRVRNDDEQPPKDVPPTDVEVLLEIRDLLRRTAGADADGSTGGGAHVAPSTSGSDAPQGTGIAGTTKL
jgi:large conductance mechanosensitive channel